MAAALAAACRSYAAFVLEGVHAALAGRAHPDEAASAAVRDARRLAEHLERLADRADDTVERLLARLANHDDVTLDRLLGRATPATRAPPATDPTPTWGTRPPTDRSSTADSSRTCDDAATNARDCRVLREALDYYGAELEQLLMLEYDLGIDGAGDRSRSSQPATRDGPTMGECVARDEAEFFTVRALWLRLEDAEAAWRGACAVDASCVPAVPAHAAVRH